MKLKQCLTAALKGSQELTEPRGASALPFTHNFLPAKAIPEAALVHLGADGFQFAQEILSLCDL